MLKAALKWRFQLLSVLAKRFRLDIRKGYEYVSDQLFLRTSSAWKLSNYGVFWSVFSCIRTEYRKIRTRKNSVFGQFSCSVKFWSFIALIVIVNQMLIDFKIHWIPFRKINLWYLSPNSCAILINESPNLFNQFI